MRTLRRMASVSGTRRGSFTRVRPWWRSPEDQPGWARPALLGLTAVAGFLYAWKAYGNLEVYYAAAVRSMSMSWHDFVFASFDPAGTTTVDKLPGAFWARTASTAGRRASASGGGRYERFDRDLGGA